MTIPSRCKFCGQELQLKADDEYFQRGDPFELRRLIPMICCNRCADYRVNCRRIAGTVKRLAEQLIFRAYSRSKPKPEELTPIKDALREALKRYMRLLADQRMTNPPDWDEAIVESVMECPKDFADVLRKMGALFHQRELSYGGAK